MAKAKQSRKELLSTNDEFITLTGRLLKAAGEHKKQLQIAGYGILAVILIYIGGYFYFGHMNDQAQDTYNEGFQIMAKDITLNKSEEDFTKSRESFEKVLADYKMSNVVDLAMPQLAYIDFLQKKYDDAITKYQEYLDSTSEEPYASLAMLSLSICYEEKGELDKALSTLEKISKSSDDYAKEQAMLSSARIYRLKNDYTKSNEILKDFIEKYPASTSLPLAKAAITS